MQLLAQFPGYRELNKKERRSAVSLLFYIFNFNCDQVEMPATSVEQWSVWIKIGKEPAENVLSVVRTVYKQIFGWKDLVIQKKDVSSEQLYIVLCR